MAKGKRPTAPQVVRQAKELAAVVLAADARLPDDAGEPEVVDGIWRGEALGTLLWALQQVDELPPFDEPFDHVELARALDLESAELRPDEELDDERQAARLWHWRARTALLQDDSSVQLPPRWSSFDQLIAATAMKGYEQGYLPPPARGDFPAFGKVYRHITPEQRSLALSIAAERHHALNWLCGEGDEWNSTPTDT